MLFREHVLIIVLLVYSIAYKSLAPMRLFLILPVLLLISARCGEEADAGPSWSIGAPEVSIKTEPLFPERDPNDMVTVWFTAACEDKCLALKKINISFTDGSAVTSLASLSAWYTGVVPGVTVRELMSSSGKPRKRTVLKGNISLASGKHSIAISLAASPAADLCGTLKIESITLTFSNGSRRKYSAVSDDPVIRFGRVVRASGQDGVDTYRIPGLVTTSAGTLIAVYDNRYNSSKDLQEDIDIGMSRSTDGGQTWEPMKVIMDMGEYGGLPQNLNGTGDPSVLYDHVTSTVWVAALWMNGSAPDRMLWWASQPGMTPRETGQVLLVKSSDDGITWSQPINITGQIKDPAWQLLLQGPGRGITLRDGTLVFPAQFKSDTGVQALDGGQYTCHSTIIYSKDGGNSWQIGTGAKSNTTEAQVVELGNGSLMLNMRDDRNRADKGVTNGRAVSVTGDLGRTWTAHPSSNSELPEPNCMASIISADLKVDGLLKKVLFFSNPDDKSDRIRMTIKTSFDEGLSWPEENRIELFRPSGYGYSCLTMVDENTLGILYEGSGELYFQKVRVNELIGK